MPNELFEQLAFDEPWPKNLLDVLHNISNGLYNNLDLEYLIKLAVLNLKRIGFHRAKILLLNEEDKLKSTFGTDKKEGLKDEHDRALSINSLPPTHGYNVTITDKIGILDDIFILREDEDKFKELWGYRPSYPGYYARTQQGDNIVLPIVISGKCIGAVSVDSFISGKRITKEESDSLAIFTVNLGIIIHNNKLMNEVCRQRELERKFAQIEKMSDLGQLVADVAHELNNPLTGVIGYAEILINTNCDEKIKRNLEIINREAQRCSKIVERLLNYSRSYEPKKEYIQINDLIDSTLVLINHQLRSDNIRVETHFVQNMPKTMADPYQMQQVFMNIINNAHQAMITTGGGKL
ncbi:hypothetical protein FJZ33_11775, partial [Candidatus Poribacteria bacterium]|nr:hypothetical protein [Candidatus Poribacteria bacterium]